MYNFLNRKQNLARMLPSRLWPQRRWAHRQSSFYNSRPTPAKGQAVIYSWCVRFPGKHPDSYKGVVLERKNSW